MKIGKIEKDRPLVEKHRKYARSPLRLALTKLEVGDSIEIENNGDTAPATFIGLCRNTIHRVKSEFPGRDFTTRTSEDKQVITIWRIA